MLHQVYRDNTMSCTYVLEWHKKFKAVCKDMKDDSKSRRPSTSMTIVNIELVKQVVCGNCWGDCLNDCKLAELGIRTVFERLLLKICCVPEK